MNLILIASLIVLPAVLYLVWEMIKEKRKGSKRLALVQAYDRLVLRNKLSIENSEDLETKIIALDRRNKKLVLIDHSDEERWEGCVSLLEIGSIEVIRERNHKVNCIKRVFLELAYKRKQECLRFCFYDEQKDPLTELPSMSRLATNWKTRLDIHKYPGVVYLQQDTC